MAFLQGDNKFRPRSKKEKQRLQTQRNRELEAKRERNRAFEESPSYQPNYTYPRRNVGISITSGSSIEPATKTTQEQIEYSEEMIERERLAQAEAEHRKKCVAPAYNKGAYQPIFTAEQAKWIGK
jgi:hypothetical protein